MSDGGVREFFDAPPDRAESISAQLFAAGRADELVSALLRELTSDSTWTREQALERLCALGDYEPLLKPLADALADDDDAEHRNAARSALAALAAPGAKSPAGALRRLRQLVTSADHSDVRLLAASAMGESGNPEVRTSLEAALSDDDPNVVSAAADALGILCDPRSVPALLRVAGGGGFWNRAAAVVALGQIGDPRAIATLADALAEPWLTSAAARALGEIGDPAALEPLRAVVEGGGNGRSEALGGIAAMFANSPGVSVPDWLRQTLREEERSLQQRLQEGDDLEAGRLLGLAGSPSAAAALVGTLSTPGREDAVAAGLSLLPREIAADAILEQVSSNSEGKRVLLLGFLPPLQTEAAVELLVRQLSHPEPEVRAAAAEALGRSDQDLVLPALERAIDDPSAHHGVALVYSRLGGARCEPLVSLLRSSSPSVRTAAAEGLGRCGGEYVQQLREAIRVEEDSAARYALVRSLGASRTEEAVAELMPLLSDPDPGLRYAAVQALGRTGLNAAFEPLLAALLDERPEIRASALAALGEIRDPRAGEPLADHLEVPDRDLRRTAIFALDRMDRPEVARQLLKALRDSDREVRLTAVRVLHRLGTAEGRLALAQVAELDPEVLVRQAAGRALSDPPPAGSGESG